MSLTTIIRHLILRLKKGERPPPEGERVQVLGTFLESLCLQRILEETWHKEEGEVQRALEEFFAVYPQIEKRVIVMVKKHDEDLLFARLARAAKNFGFIE